MKRKPKRARPLWGRRSVRRDFVCWRARGFEYGGGQRLSAHGRAEFFGVAVERVSRPLRQLVEACSLMRAPTPGAWP